MYDKFIKWYSKPKNKRKPRTLEGFCELYNIKRKDIDEFKDRPTFQSDVAMATRKWAKDRIPELIHILYETAQSSGNVNSIEGFMRLLQEDEEEKGNSFEEIINKTIFTDEQRQQIADRIAGRGGFDRPRGKK